MPTDLSRKQFPKENASSQQPSPNPVGFGEKKTKEKKRAARWVVTFADLMTLLFCFFVYLTMVNQQEKVDWQIDVDEILESIGSVTIQVNLSAAKRDPIQVSYLVSGTAVLGKDHQLTRGTITIPPGETIGSHQFDIINNLIDEESRTIDIILEKPEKVELGENISHTITILDDDEPPVVELFTEQTKVDESNSIALTARINQKSGYEIKVPYIISGTATIGEDHDLQEGWFTIAPGQLSQTISLQAFEDNIGESAESVIVTLDQAENAILGTQKQASLIINDLIHKEKVEWTIDFDQVSEAAGALTIQVQMSAESQIPIEIPFLVTGTAEYGKDHDLNAGVITIPPGKTTAEYQFNIIDNARDENDRKLVLVLEKPNNAELGKATSHTITITDDDAPPSVELVSSKTQITESNPMALTVQLNRVSGFDVKVPYAVTGTAVSGKDHNFENGWFTIASGQLSQTVSFRVLDDNENDSGETMVITLGKPENAVLGSQQGVTLTINDVIQQQDCGPLDSYIKQQAVQGFELQATPLRCTISLPQDFLFQSGKSEVVEATVEKLQPLFKIIETNHADDLVIVEGHTDDKPFTGYTKLLCDRYPSESDSRRPRFCNNWQLSVARAANVAALLRKYSVFEKISATGFAETRPKVEYKNKTGRALDLARTANRRVEIVLINDGAGS